MKELSAPELEGFLRTATEDQRTHVLRLRAFIQRGAPTLEEKLNDERWLRGYLWYGTSAEPMVYAIGLTALKTVTLHAMPLYGSIDLQSRYRSHLVRYATGKSCLRFRPHDTVPAEVIEGIVACTDTYLRVVAMRARQ